MRNKKPIVTGLQPISSTILRMISIGRLSRVGVIVCVGHVAHGGGGDTVLHRLYGRSEGRAESFSSGILAVGSIYCLICSEIDVSSVVGDRC